MKIKYLLVGLGFALLSASAQAIEPGLYISNKLAGIITRTRDNKSKYSASVPPGEGTSDSDMGIGNRVAVGFETLLDMGKMRTEFEVGLSPKIKVKVVSKKQMEEVMYARSRSMTYTLNAYYDFETRTIFTPYVGFGIGIANINAKYNYDSVIIDGQYMKGKVETNNFTYNFGIGVSCAIDEQIFIDFGYRHTNFGTVEGPIKYKEYDYGSVFDLDYVITHSKVSSNEILLGLRYSF
ncbi:MAG: outer membrane beta-barrel protein [Rickettsiales bacterium]|jgi:opacity protein-like surface antigen|nr:outer membrane beta-barrel protein [Rickettsiales bacterium]